MSRSAVAVATLILVGLGGCGTVSNLSPPQNAAQSGIPEQRFTVFGGVGNDINQVRWVWQQPGVVGKAVAPLVALDIPLSLVGDTLTLPITVTDTFLPVGWFVYGDEPPPDPQILDRWRRFWFDDQGVRATAWRTDVDGK